jgi:hypothetical protein
MADESESENGNQPATKADLKALETRFDQKIEDLEVRMDNRFLANEHRMEQLLLEQEGRMMTSLYRLLESGNLRLTQNKRETAAIKERLGLLEGRVLDLERRRDTPPKPE